MTDQSPEPADPWAPPDRAAMDRGGQYSASGAPGAAGGPASVHDQPTITGMPGGGGIQPPQPPQPQPQPYPGQPSAEATPAYGYPAQPDTGGPGYGYGYGYGYPGGAHTGQARYTGYPAGSGYPAYAVPMRNGFGVTALVLGIISVALFCTSFFAVALGVTAVIFGVLGRGRAARGEADNGGVALAGIILGAVGIVVGTLLLALLFADMADDDGDRDGGSEYDPPTSTSQVLHRG
ncbi:DUF4190 domain-containing protein [Streptomyces sp. NPDC051211]|uniref:DUF4190 domain-containing protein n=1 Tax=Streptomyces sp. NPDC051211 TaxID=3154643 RepID=UPI00344B33B7